MEGATLTLYRVHKCGYYADDQFQFAAISETLEAFHQWTNALNSIGESCTYTTNEDDTFLRAFCLDVKKVGRTHARLVVTWNELEHTEEGVQTVAMTSRIGHAEVGAVQVDALSLPGYPAYFYVDPVQNIVVNLRFEQRLNGSRQFQRFIQGFLAGYSDWCIWNNERTNLRGYGLGGRIARGIVPEFATTMVRRAGDMDYIRTNVDSIRKIIRRAVVSPVIEEHKTFLDSAFQLIGWAPNNRLRADMHFQYEFKTRLDTDKLNQVVAEYEKDRDDSWNDVGFVFKRAAQKVHWLSGGIARSEYQIDVRRNDDGMIDVDSLVEYLVQNGRDFAETLENGD